MTPLLSVVIASHNDPFLKQTVKSIHDTAGPWCEIIVVDDCSASAVFQSHFPPTAKVVRNSQRLGVGASRHRGIKHATAPLILITDAHMLFDKDWFQPTLDVLRGSDTLLICGQMLALDEDSVDLQHPKGVYNGARMLISDPTADPRWRLFAPKWIPDKPGDFYPLTAVMGALYGFHKSFYDRIGGLNLLREFGGDEEMLSVKTLRAGGTIRMFKQLRAGHRFRTKTKPPYRVRDEMCLFNSMVVAHVCCPQDVAKELIGGMGSSPLVNDARRMVAMNMPQIAAERDTFAGVWKLPWTGYLNLIASIDGKA